MHKLSIIDRHEGDKEIEWDPNNPESVEKARKAFDKAKEKGHLAYKMVKDTTRKAGEQIKEFDPSLDGIIMRPQSSGG